MPYLLYIKSTAEKDILTLPSRILQQIKERILVLSNNPRPKGCKKLEGDIKYRIRVGDYRILYKINDVKQSIEVVAVGHRKDVYRY